MGEIPHSSQTQFDFQCHLAEGMWSRQPFELINHFYRRSRSFHADDDNNPRRWKSIATLNLTALELGELLDDGGVPLAVKGIDAEDTKAAPVEPLSTSY